MKVSEIIRIGHLNNGQELVYLWLKLDAWLRELGLLFEVVVKYDSAVVEIF